MKPYLLALAFFAASVARADPVPAAGPSLNPLDYSITISMPELHRAADECRYLAVNFAKYAELFAFEPFAAGFFREQEKFWRGRESVFREYIRAVEDFVRSLAPPVAASPV